MRRKRKWLGRAGAPLVVAGVILLGGSLSAADTAESLTTFVFIHPEQTALWTTGQGSTFSVPVTFPEGATTARLAVRGSFGYSADYDQIAEKSFTLTLPRPANPTTEDVYDLTLTFDDGTVRTARLGCVVGYDGTDVGSTRCLVNASPRKWGKVKEHAVLPVPCGATTLTVGGQDRPTGLAGAAGWAPLDGKDLEAGHLTTVSATGDGVALEGDVLLSGGIAVYLK